jgi:osmotically-inducible protein OsmY
MLSIVIRLISPLSVLGFLLSIAACATVTGNDAGARTPGAIIDDEFIERIAKSEIGKADMRLAAGNINVISFNGIVLLTGQVEDEALKATAKQVLKRIRKARKIQNEIRVGGLTSMLARANDILLTTKVKAKLISDKNVNADRIKVITEDGVVFLMGLVTRSESDTAVDVTRSVFGVQQIVKVFEYVE